MTDISRLSEDGLRDARRANRKAPPIKPGNELLRDLSLGLDAVGTLPGHGFHPLKAQLTLSNY
jgi:hypothetical protein